MKPVSKLNMLTVLSFNATMMQALMQHQLMKNELTVVKMYQHSQKGNDGNRQYAQNGLEQWQNYTSEESSDLLTQRIEFKTV